MTAPTALRAPVTGITIDATSTRDIDDAIWVELVTDETDEWWATSKPYWRIRVSIADVESIVPRGGMDDVLARKQVETLYFAQGNSPMLPRQLSEQDASLWPHLSRNTLTTEIRMSTDLNVFDTRVFRSVLISQAKLAYADIPKILGNPTNKHHQVVTWAHQLAQSLLQKRRKEGALVLYDLASGWVTTEDGQLKKLDQRTDTGGYILIQEMMILANSAMAHWVTSNNIPILYRNHEAHRAAPPREELASKLESAQFIPIEDIDLIRRQTYLVLQRAKYSPVIRGHYGLNLPAYTHLTSPIRRYADLINQRQIAASLLDIPFPYSKEELEVEAEHINEVLTQAQLKNSEDRKKAVDDKALKHIQTGKLDTLNIRDFERVTKVEARSGNDPSDVFVRALERRLMEGRAPLISLTTIFAEAPKTGAWASVRKLILNNLKPSDGPSIFGQLESIAKWPSPSLKVTEEGPSHARIFQVRASTTVDGMTFESIPFEALTLRDAKQRATIGLIAEIFGIEPPKFEFEKTAPASISPTKKKLDASKNPIQALNEFAQTLGLGAPLYEFVEKGPGHRREFECTCSFGEHTSTGSGPSKQEAKTQAAKKAVLHLSSTP